jgi:hypothetical protein
MSRRSRSSRSHRAVRIFGLFTSPGLIISGKSRPVIATSFLLITLFLTSLNNPFVHQEEPKANASVSGDKVALYLSAPLVQGSGVEEAVKANFNSTNLNAEACPPSLEGIGSLTFMKGSTEVEENQRSTVCSIDPWTRADSPTTGSEGVLYGGASSEASTPFFGGSGTSFMAIPFGDGSNDRSITFNLEAAAKYVGFWWSGGNAGNLVSFYDSAGNLVAEIDSLTITEKLKTDVAPNYVESIGGSQFLKTYYYGNPVYYTSETTKPAAGTFAAYADCCIFTYLNIYVEGSLDIRKVKFSGRGFEFDNLAISTVQKTPEQNMVKIVEKNSADLSWEPATSLLLSAASASPASATTTGNGAITYSVKSQGGTGCSVNASSGALTYSAVGSCVVTVTSAETSTTYKATQDVTFVISTQLVEAPGEPGTPTVVPGNASATLSWTPSTTGTAPISYTVETIPSGGTCVVAASGTGSTATCTGLTNGVAYQFRVTATNGPSSSSTSGTSASITPERPVNQNSALVPLAPPTNKIARTVVPGFAANSTTLTKAMRQEVRSFLRANPNLHRVVCRGFTSAPATAQDKALARQRGKVTCDLIKKLRPQASVTIRSGSHTDKPGVQIRRVKITLR